MIDTMRLTPDENTAYIEAFMQTLHDTNSYVKAKEAGIQAVEAMRQQQEAEVTE